MYWFIIDIIMVFVIIMTTFSAMRRGFVTSLVRLLGIAVSIIAAIVAAKLLSGYVFERWFREDLVVQVADRIVGATDVESLAKAIQSGLLGVIIGVFDDTDILIRLIKNTPLRDNRAMAEAVVDNVVRDPVESLIGMVLFLLVFVIMIIITVIAVKVSGVLTVIPVVSGVNRFFGALFGIAYGIGICYMVTMIFALFFRMTGNTAEYGRIVEENTILFAMLYRMRAM